MVHPYDRPALDSSASSRPRAADDRSGKEGPPPSKKDHPAPKDADDSKGSGRKHGVQRNPEDQRGRPDPTVKDWT